MARAPRICNVRGCGDHVHRLGKCRIHAAEYDAHMAKTTPTKRTNNFIERKRRAAAVDKHRRRYGDFCPGYKRDPHPSSDLTAEHVYAIGDGGSPSGPLIVLCRSCNGRGGAEVRNRYR